jgi:branched-chain amino acid transport system substrate-binding protein
MRVHSRIGVAVLSLALVAGACGNENEDAAPTTTAVPTASVADGATTTSAAEEPDEGEVGTDGARAAAFADLVRLEPPNPCPAIPGISGTEITVGMIGPLSGVRAQSFAAALEGVRARFDKANQEGELGGFTVRVVEGDDGSDAARNAEVARTLVESQGVYGIVEVSDQSDGSADYLNSNGIPVTGWHVGRGHWAKQENFFAFRLPGAADPMKSHQTRAAQVIEELGGSTVAIVGGGNESSVQFVRREEAAMAARGLEVVYSTTDVVSGNTEFTGIVQRIADAGADTLVTGMDFLQNTALAQQLADAGVELAVTLFPGGYDPRVLGLPGIEGATFGLEFIPFQADPPAFTAFDEYLPEGQTRNQITYTGWLSAEMFVRGLLEAGLECPTREAFINNLRLLDDYDGGGAFDPVDLNAEASWGPAFLCAYYVQVQGGDFVPLFDAEPRCGDPLALG